MSASIGVHDPFSFEHGGRTFTCCVETPRVGAQSSMRGSWWWFAVSTERHQRHAPFPATDADTRDEIQARIVAFYDTMEARRTAPYENPWQARARARREAGEAAPPAAT